MVERDKNRDKRKRTRDTADPAQYERFTEAAHEAGCDDNPERMDEVIRRAAKLPPPRQTPKTRQPKKSD